MRRKILSTLFVICFVSVAALAAPQRNARDLSSEQQQLLSLLNAERISHGLEQLQWDNKISKAALAHAQLMAGRRELSHGFPSEALLRERLGVTGLRFNLSGENLAAGPTVQNIHAGLMASPVHRANILEENFNAVGIAVIVVDGRLFVVENFARVLPTYSESDFRNAVIAAVKKAREEVRAPKVHVEDDARLHLLACSENPNPATILKMLPGVFDAVVFTSSVPEHVSPDMTDAARQTEVRTISLGICFNPGKAHGYASFTIVAAFSP